MEAKKEAEKMIREEMRSLDILTSIVSTSSYVDTSNHSMEHRTAPLWVNFPMVNFPFTSQDKWPTYVAQVRNSITKDPQVEEVYAFMYQRGGDNLLASIRDNTSAGSPIEFQKMS